MKPYSLFCLFIVLFFGLTGKLQAQNVSNEGTDFWAVFPTHDPSGNQLANMNIFITSKRASEVTVSCGAYTETKAIPANTVVVFAVPRANSYIETSDANRNLTNRGIHIKVTAGQPAVAVYAHVYAGARSAASLIIPFEALGQKYYSMNYRQDANGNNFLVLVAAEDNTTLKLTEKNGNVRTITLAKAGDVYEYLGAASTDLTGVYVEVDELTSKCKRFAAFSGSTSLTIQCTNSRDPLLQQLYTTNSWGKTYAVAPFINRRCIVRVLAQENNTRINIDGLVTTLNKGEFYESGLLIEGTIVTADKLISVAQYSLTQNCSSVTGTNLIGDPDMILLNPVEFSIKKITLFSSDQQAIQQKYINVVIKTDSRGSFKVNGASPANGIWKTFPSNTAYSYIQIQVYDQSLTLSADEGFNAIAYGFGNAESYGYSAGTSLAANQYLTVIDTRSNEEYSNACIGETANFKITLPYLLTRLVWQFDDGTPNYDDTSPSPVVRTVNGETLYDYIAPVNKNYTVAGQKVIKATGYFAINSNSCFGSTADFEFLFNVDPEPTASFTTVAQSCLGTEIVFTDASNSNVPDKAIKKWMWDFGDGTPISNVQNPKHVYANSGIFTVKLIVSAENGCSSEVFQKDVHVLALPIAKFIAKPTALCEQQVISFENQSTSAEGRLVKWLWDFGDNQTSTDENPVHTYGVAGQYEVKLTITSEFGCENAVAQIINVNTLPLVDFDLPDFCLADGSAIFTNKATITTGEQLTYLWDFGDANASPQRPNTSTLRNGSHVYTSTGLYEVTLTVKSASGCTVIRKKQFRVNGSVPKAAFDIENQNALCSNSPVVFKDKATVDFGEITKIEWFFDYLNKTTPDIVDEEPNLRADAAKLYNFKYPTFTGQQSMSYVVKMRAYSGGACVSEETKNITIYPDASVDFNLQTSCLVNGQANFENLSTYAAANATLTYQWNFGDQNANSQNPNVSTLKDPSHRYTQVGRYTVSLTVVTPFGCTKTFSKEINIEGAVPQADFTIRNASTLCSQTPVVFDDRTTIAFGNITRVDWYYDFANNPSQLESDFSPGSSINPKTYTHQYPVFGVPFSKSYVVKMVAYSGNTCVSAIEKTITLNASPEIEFNQTMEICLEAPGVQLLATEKNGLPGAGTFSGDGVSASGLFNPAKAGAGVHVITYTYEVTNGCKVQKTQNITVNETPMVDAGEDKNVLEGGMATLSATAFGFGKTLTYKWIPATGLDRNDVLNPVVRPTEDMLYRLIVTSEKGCVQTDEVFVKVLKNLEIPSAITPNGDAINDEWNLKYIDSYPAATVEIFDRGGQNVFRSKGYVKPFDGTYNHTPLPVGVYYYIINLAVGKKPITGTLTIIR